MRISSSTFQPVQLGAAASRTGRQVARQVRYLVLLVLCLALAATLSGAPAHAAAPAVSDPTSPTTPGAPTPPADPADPADPGTPEVPEVLAEVRVPGTPLLRTFHPAQAVLTRDGAPVSGGRVRFERNTGQGWGHVRTLRTGPGGRATIRPWMGATTVRLRAVVTVPATMLTVDGLHGPATVSAPAARVVTPVVLLRPMRQPSALKIGGARAVLDGRAATLTGSWRTSTKTPVRGALVRLDAQLPGGRWWTVRRARTNQRGVVRFVVRPRVDVRYRMWGPAGSWWRADLSGVRAIDNRPPVRPVTAPRGAPSPMKLPAQPRGTGGGANIVVSKIPNRVWRDMVGRSWRPGCPVGRSGLRLIRANYWAFDGYRRRGELVVNAAIAHKYVGALRDLYAHRVPIRAMYRVDRFGYSPVSGGADDYAAMASDNTSAFNCRNVSGNPGRRSPHSTGRSFDINPWENPYRSNWGFLPNNWWPSRSDARVAWRSSSHLVVRLMARNGFRWTYGHGDLHHFDG